MITNKQQRDKIVKQLDEARDYVRVAHTSMVPIGEHTKKAEELIVKAIANLYRLNL